MIIKMARGAELLKVFHTHDCDQCVFLGHVGLVDRVTGNQDVWYCPEWKTLMLRSGPDSDYQTLFAQTVYGENHPAHDAWNLLQNFQLDGERWIALDVVPMDQRPEDEEEDESRYETVDGLYADLKVKETDKNLFVRDQHGNPLGVARKLAVSQLGNDDSKEYRFRPYEGLPLANLPMEKSFYSKRALFLYVMWLQQEMEDGGH